jgi:D-alanyl-D-alanine carboxypeptidase (penicillin-binding protein 5/6)
MKRSALLWISALGLSLLSSQGFSSINPTPTPPQIDAPAYILVDYQSGRVLADKEPDKRIEPASLTKMMTVYVVDHELKAGRLSLTSEVPISENAWRTEGSRSFVDVGKKIPVDVLLHGIIIQSGNDAAVALAEFVAGTEGAFAEMMNKYAKQLGMNNTHFMNATGIPHADHYTTARDLSKLAHAVVGEFPNTYKIYSEKWFSYNGIKQPNRNRLLWREPYVDGIKTGHSSTAGYCLAASGQKDNMRLVSIVLGAQSESDRTEQTLALLRFGFRFYETKHLFKANTQLNEPRVWMGSQNTMPIGLKEDLFITIPHGQYKNLDAKMLVNQRITAPIKKGDTFGKIVVKLNDTVVSERPLVALKDIPEGSAWSRMSDYFSLALHKALNSKDAQEGGEPTATEAITQSIPNAIPDAVKPQATAKKDS